MFLGCLLDGFYRDSTFGSESGRLPCLRPRVQEDRQPAGHVRRAAGPARAEAAEEQPDADGHLDDPLSVLAAHQLVQHPGKRDDGRTTSLDVSEFGIDDNWLVVFSTNQSRVFNNID